MGREVKRVPLDFNWEGIWPGYMKLPGNVCTEEVRYTMKKKITDVPELDEVCARCKEFAKLAGIKIYNAGGCPDTRHHPLPGDGWQLWETTTEGSPLSPVFETAEELAGWIADGNDWENTTYEQAIAFVNKGWAPSLIIDDGVHPGIQKIGEMGD